MRLLLDEQLSNDIAAGLRDRGHDVVAVKDQPAWMGMTDDEIMELARRERRGVVTNNVRDYRPLAARSVLGGEGHFGMVFMPGGYRRTRADIGRIVRALEAVLEAHPADDALANRELWI